MAGYDIDNPLGDNEVEEDVCRVCRVEADEDNPMVHPCKCSGSVKYVHSDCLKSWLATSQKRYCEICGHKYEFTKVYPDYVPTVIPTIVYFRQTLLYALRSFLLVLRGCLVVTSWLILLPAFTMLAIRSLMWFTDLIAGLTLPKGPKISRLSKLLFNANTTLPEDGNLTLGIVEEIVKNATQGEVEGNVAGESEKTFTGMMYTLLRLQWREMLNGDDHSMAGFIFRGQILSICLAGVIVALILLREWISQHDWAQYDQPPPTLPPIDPDEWIVNGGVARKVEKPAERPFPIRRSTSDDFPDLKARRTGGCGHDIPGMPSTNEEPSSIGDRTDLQGDGETEIRKEAESGDGDKDKLTTTHLLSEEERRQFRLNYEEAVAAGNHRKTALIDKRLREDDERKKKALESTLQGEAGPSTKGLLASPFEPDAHITPFADTFVVDRSGEMSPPDTGNTDISLQDILRNGPSLDETPRARATAGPGPSTEAHRRSSSGERRAMYNNEETTESLEAEMEAARRALVRGQVDWRAPEIRITGVDDDEEEDMGSPIIRFDGNGVWQPPSSSDPADPSGAAPTEFDLLDQMIDEQVGLPDNPLEYMNTDPPLHIQRDLELRIAPAPAPVVANVAPPVIRIQPPPEALNANRQRRILLRNRRRMENMPEVEDDEDNNDDNDNENENENGDGEEWEDLEVLQGGGNAVIGAGAAEVDVEELEGGWEREDWDGILEVVGMVGPIQNLAQNMLLVMVIMSCSLFILAGIPMAIGKLALCLDVLGTILATGQYLLRGIRFFTDPAIDLVWEIVREVLVRPAFASIKALEKILAVKIGFTAPSTSSISLPQTQMVNRLITAASKYPFLEDLLHRVDNIDWKTQITRLGDFFAWIGRNTTYLHGDARQMAYKLAISDSMSDRIWCIVIGWAILIFGVAGAAFAGEANYGRATTGFAGEVRKYAMFLKLACFMTLEMVAFPLGTGILVNLAVLPLFPNVTALSRIGQLRSSPFSTLFIAWLAGTCFMYAFAQALGWIRSMCRPGTMFFIRDPQDPNFAPTKDMIERPIGSQMRKLWSSATLYSLLICCLLGVNTWLVGYQKQIEVLPLKLDKHGPLSSIPFDLIFLLVAVPRTVRNTKIRVWIKRSIGLYWRMAARLFGLSQLLLRDEKDLGKEQPPEHRITRAFWATIDMPMQIAFGKYVNDAAYTRVPAQDQVVLLSKVGIKGNTFVPLTAEGEPQTPKDKLRILQQDAAARTVNRDPAKDYIMIWLPRYWRTRIHIFVIFSALMAGTGLAAVLLGPLIVGRALMGMIFGEVHDGYSLLTGYYILRSLFILGRRLQKRIISWNRAASLRRSTLSVRYKRLVLSILHRSYAILALFLIHPLLRGLLWEIRLGVLIRYGLRDIPPVIHVWDCWALGSVLDALEVGLRGSFGHRGIPPNRRDRLHDYYRSPLKVGFHQLNTVAMPIIGRMILEVVLPFVWAGAISLIIHWTPLGPIITDDMRALNFRMAGPASYACYVVVKNQWGIIRYLSKLKQTMIDAEYVVEERVENYNGPTVEEEAKANTAAVTALDAEIDQLRAVNAINAALRAGRDVELNVLEPGPAPVVGPLPGLGPLRPQNHNQNQNQNPGQSDQDDEDEWVEEDGEGESSA